MEKEDTYTESHVFTNLLFSTLNEDVKDYLINNSVGYDRCQLVVKKQIEILKLKQKKLTVEDVKKLLHKEI